MGANDFKHTPEPPKTKTVRVGASVDPLVKKRAEALGLDLEAMIKHFVEDAVGHYVCPTCGALLRATKKKT